MIPISLPDLGTAEQQAVAKVLASGMLAQGPRVAEFEGAFAEFIGVKHAVATTNGTTALHAALLAHGIGAGDEVITTPFTFIASVNAILYTGARPVFVDIDESFNLNANLVEKSITERTKAIMPVHLYGQAADMDALVQIGHRRGLVLIEDSCQAHGATWNGRKAGAFGTGCFSFYATKNMTTGEGGMITTDDDNIARRVRRIINHGTRVRYYHEDLGYNYRMTDIAAAIGIEQLKKLPAFNVKRVENANFYNHSLGQLPGLSIPKVYPQRNHVYHQYTIRVTRDARRSRDQLAETLREHGIGTGIYYPVPVHLQESMAPLQLSEGAFPVAEAMSREVLSIPVHPRVTEAERSFIVENLVHLLS